MSIVYLLIWGFVYARSQGPLGFTRYVQTRVLPGYTRPLEEPGTTGAGLTVRLEWGIYCNMQKLGEGYSPPVRKHRLCKKHHCEFSYRKSYPAQAARAARA
jgi:hypothetical protein